MCSCHSFCKLPYTSELGHKLECNYCDIERKQNLESDIIMPRIKRVYVLNECKRYQHKTEVFETPMNKRVSKIELEHVGIFAEPDSRKQCYDSQIERAMSVFNMIMEKHISKQHCNTDYNDCD